MNSAAVVVYSSDFCPYCYRAESLLQRYQVAYQRLNVDGNPELRQAMAKRAGRTSVPQIWIGDLHVGGCDDLYGLEQQGELAPLLAAVTSSD